MTRPWHVWLGFTLCLVVVLGAMGWISRTALDLERAEVDVRRHADLEEKVRLALWRMESALAPIIAEESTRPYFAYTSFYSPDRSFTRGLDENEPGEVLVPSPLMAADSPYIVLHFQMSPDGQLTSPQVPVGEQHNLANRLKVTSSSMATAASHLADLQGLIDPDLFLNVLPAGATVAMAAAPPPTTIDPGPQGRLQQARQLVESQRAMQQQRSVVERRTRVAQQAENVLNVDLDTLPFASDVTKGTCRPVWLGDILLLARRVSIQGREYVQGCWLAWPEIKSWLLGEVRDLLPEVELEPVRSAPSDSETRMLAALPIRLIPGGLPEIADGANSPMRTYLLIAWIGVLLAAGAVAVLLSGTISLSERRAAFVSAVTHEMRTPLTTFRMYTDMLIKGMIPDEAKRQRYLATLRAEAVRLGHLVENVLAYARLERGRKEDRREPTTLRELIDRVEGRLAARSEQADMVLVVEGKEEALRQRIRVDMSAVEQILFNLVDNACKYAATAENRRIHLEIDRAGRQAIVRVKDHGPGIAQADSRRLFRPFSKSAQEAAHSAPGVGLGLALSRRLARDMGGDLRLDHHVTTGGCFALILPAA